MFIDARTLDNDHVGKFDLCIIGAGAAGITIARELKNDQNLSICLIESGGEEYNDDTQSLYETESTGLEYDTRSTRLRYLGGSTNHWGGVCGPMLAHDFEERSWVPNSGWPITLTDLKPYYRKAQKTLELKSDDYSESRWGKQHPAFASYDVQELEGVVRQNRAKRFIDYADELKAQKNLTTYLHANVAEIVPSQNGEHIDELKVVTFNKKTQTIKAKQYILACGALENARMLLLSDRYTPQGLGNQNDIVGRYFMEHPGMTVGKVSLYKHTHFYEYFGPAVPYKDIQFRLRLGLTPKYQRKHKLLGTAFTFWGDESTVHEKWNDMDRAAAHVSLLNKPLDQPRIAFVNAGLELTPDPDSRLTLVTTKDKLGLRKGSLHWSILDSDKEQFTRSCTHLAKVIAANGIGRMQVEPWILENGFEFKQPIHIKKHQAGTTRMHHDPKQGVVDKHAKVHGVDNLYIMGSSLFTTCGEVNPTLTIIALTHRLVSHLKRKI